MNLLAVMTVHPWLALGAAGFLALLWRWSRSRVAAAGAVLWAGYCGYEYLMLARVLCTGECNIRVDLLVIYPVLGLLLLAGTVAGIRARIVTRRAG